MNFKQYIEKLQSLPEQKKKIILWTVVAILGLIMGIFWFRSAGERIYKINNDLKNTIQSIKIPEEVVAPSDTNLENK